MRELIAIFSIPLVLMNTFGIIAGIVWLGIIGAWEPLFIVIGVLIISPYALAFPLLLSMIFLIPAAWLADKGELGKWLCSPFLILGGSVTWITMAFWGHFVFYKAFQYSLIYTNFNHLWPFLLCAYGASTGPWSFMASKEDNQSNLVIPLFITQIACFVFMLGIGFMVSNLDTIILTYYTIIGIGFLISVLTGLASLDAPKISH